MAALNMYTSSLAITAAVLVFARSGVLCAPLCLTGDFDSQLQHILHTRMLSAQDIANMISRVLGDVQTTLNKRWPGHKATPFGSLTTGLGTSSSDVDLYVQLPNYNQSMSEYVLQETEKLFKKQPNLYTRIRYNYRSNLVLNCTLFQFYHIPSAELKVDLMFDFGAMGVANSKLVKYYFSLDKRFLPMGGFIKFWFKIQKQYNALLPHNFALYFLIIFYLQQKNLAPPIYVLQNHSKSHFIGDWDVGFDELPYNSTNTESVHQLLGGFFKYYSEFNFEEYVISPFAGRPIMKSAFLDIENFPKEYSIYNSNLKHTLQNKVKNGLYSVGSDVCLQDPFLHSLNMLDQHTAQGNAKFKDLMKSVATMFEDLPSDSILKAIIVMRGLNETVISHKNATVDVINGQDCIEVA